MKKKIAVIAGGNSSEYVVSLKSAENVARALDKTKYDVYIVRIQGQEWVLQGEAYCDLVINKNDFSFSHQGQSTRFDLAYIMIHGTPGEDGLLQAYFHLQGIPYTTGDTLNMALSFNKYYCNQYLKGFGIEVADSLLLLKGQPYDPQQITERLGLPCFVKPSDAGSSFGVSKVKTVEELPTAIEKAFAEGQQVVIERFIDGTEVTCGVLKTPQHYLRLPITEIVSKNEFFDYQAKYTPEFVQEITPARLSPELTARIQDLSARIYDLLNCRGIVRVDFIVQNGTPFLLELNTVPGMSSASIIPQQIRALGLEPSQVFDWVIEGVMDGKA